MSEKNEVKARIAYEVLVILSIFALLTFIIRLWPILLLIMLGIIVCALRMLFLKLKTVKVIVPAEPIAPPPPETEQSIIQKAFGLLQRRISDQLEMQFPGARWVRGTPNAMLKFARNEPLIVLLNSAGGYAKAQVLVHNLIFKGLQYRTLNTGKELPEAHETSESDESEPDLPVNYERLAFDWVDANLTDINEMCNEAIGGGKNEALISADDLPHSDSWADIRKELKRNGFPETVLCKDGIKIILTL